MMVCIQCKKWIKPATPTPPHLHKYQLSSIDQLQPPNFIQPIFYFDHISSSETDEVVKTTIPGRLLHLEESLSKVLTLYYPFAGRIYDEDESLVLCQDQGVAFVVAKLDRKLDELADDGEDDTKVLLSALESLRTWNPLMMVQVNIFTCGGLAISLCISHKLCDMFTISIFMKSWATACRLGTLDEVVRPSFSFSSLLPAPMSGIHFPKRPASGINMVIPPKYVMKRYIFTGEAIAKIRSASIIISEESSSSSDYYTRVELVMAVIARSLTNNKPLVITQPMNFRSKTGLPIEGHSCGNLLTSVIANCGNGLLSWELPEVAKLIKNSIKNASSEMGKVRDWGQLSDEIIRATLEFHEELKKRETVNLVMFTSWCRLPLYEVDFGWGRPTLVSTVPLMHNFIRLLDSKSDKGGIEAWVCLKEQDMARFQQEQDILKYASLAC